MARKEQLAAAGPAGWLEGAAFLCLLALASLLPLIYSTRAESHFVLVKQWLFEPAVLLVLTLWIGSMALGGTLRLTRTMLYPLVAVFLAACLLSLLDATPYSAAATEFRAWLAAALGFMLVANLVRTRIRIWAFLGGIALAGLLEALIGTSQFIGKDWLFRVEGDIAGTLGNSNYLGGLLAMCWFPLVAVALGARAMPGPGRARGLVLVAALALSALLGAGLLFTECQSAYLGAALGFTALAAALVAGRKPGSRLLASSGTALLVVLAVASMGSNAETSGSGDSERDGFFTLEERATKGRLIIWRATLHMVRDHPVAGTGLGTYAYHYPDYLAKSLQGVEIKPIHHLLQFVRKPHSAYLQVWSETGTLGLVSFLLLLLVYFVSCLKTWKRLDRVTDRYALLGIACGQLALVTTLAASSLLVIAPMREYFWIFLGLPAGLLRAVGPGRERKWALPSGSRVLPSLLLIGLPLAAWIAGSGRAASLYRANVYWSNGIEATRANQLADAVAWYDRALELTPRLHELRYLRGSVLGGMAEIEPDPARQRRYLDDAIAALEEAAEGYSDPALYSNLGRLYALRGEQLKSLAWYQREAATGLNYTAAHTKVGTALMALGREEEAGVEWEAALAVDPELDWVRFNLGMLRMRQKRHAEAGEHFRLFLERNPASLEAHNNLGLSLMETDRVAEAVDAFERALHVQPDNVWVLNNLGAAWHRLGRIDLARRQWAHVIEIDPDNTLARENLARWDAAESP